MKSFYLIIKKATLLISFYIILLNNLYAQNFPIKIGVLVDLSGPYKELGTVTYEALQKYLTIINDSGGIKGRVVELIFSDTGGTDSGILLGASKLKEQGVIAIIGPSSKENVILLRRYAETYKMPLMLISGSSPILTYRTIKTKWTFSSTLNFDAEIKSLFRAFRKRGYKNLSVLVQASDFYKELSLWIRGYAPEYKLNIGCFEAFYLNKEDLEFKLKYISRCMPDVCLIWADENALDAFMQIGSIQIPVAISHNLLRKDLFSNNKWSLSFISIPKILAKNFTGFISLSSQQIFFFSAWPKDDFYNLSLKQQMVAINSWDSLRILTTALKSGADISRSSLRASLEENIKNYPGLIGNITFDKRDHSGLDPASLTVLMNFEGRWRRVR